MNSYARILGMTIFTTKLLFYNIADNLQYQKKLSTIEFVFRQNLTLEQELTINEFYSNITKPLNLKDIEGITVFKALDVNKRQKIRVEDFVIVIDSYRDDNSFYAKKISEIEDKNLHDGNLQNNESWNPYGLNDVQLFWINKYCSYLKTIDITERMAFDSAKIEPENKDEKINLDNLKRKLKILIPKELVSATELNNISDAFDINNNRILSYDDYIGIIESCKNDPKFALLFKKNDNEYPLMNYMINKGTDLKKLPLRTNKDFFKNEENRRLENNINNNLFENEDNLIGTNAEYPNDNAFPLKKSQLNNLPSFLQPKHETNKKISEFLKELDVFESGEWSLIELLEDFDIYNNEEFSPTYELYKVLEDKFTPTIPKEKISNCVNEIDTNKNGYISYLDLINFLLNNLRYKSSKIGWKEVTRKIIYGLNMSADDFFNREFKNEKSDNSEISFIEFTKLITKTFDIAPPVAKQMYDDLQSLISGHRITKGDLIDTVNRQLEYNKNINEKRKIERELFDNGLINQELPVLNTGYMSSLRKDNAKEYNAISLLDKKYYEQEMKNFVKLLQKGFVPTGETEIKEVLVNNLKLFLNLPENLKMSQFRELFIKPLGMDYGLGIATFQLVKSYNKDNTTNDALNKTEILSTINTDTLFDVLTSYVDFNLSNFEPRLFLYYLENGRFSPLKMCFESIPYNYEGIAILDLIRQMEIFYPKLPKIILKNVIKDLDHDEKGLITYKDLCDFIYENCSKENNRFSDDLILKHLASILDIKHVDTEPFLKNAIYKRYNKSNKGKENIVNLDMHNNYFIVVLKFNTEQSESFFLFLSNIKNKNCYTLQHLVKLINSIRTEQGKIDETYIIEEKKDNLKGKFSSKKISELLNTFATNLPLCDAFHNLTIDSSLCISVIELHERLMENYSHSMDVDRELLKHMYKKMDKNKNGLIFYNDFHKFIKNNCINEKYEGCYMLHLRYWSSKVNNDFGGNYSEYLTYKGLISNKYLSKEAFEICFQVEECLNDSDLCNSIFNYLKEKSGTHENMVYVQNLIDYLKAFSDISNEGSNFKLEEDSVSLKENEYHEIIRETIQKHENNGENFTQIFDKLKMNPDVNNFGKINYRTIREIFIDDYGMNMEQLKAFKDNFCRVPLLFDLLLLCNTCQEISKFKVNENDIKDKIKINIPHDQTFSLFCKKYSISPNKPLGLSEFTEYSKSIFKLSSYECLIIFQKMWIDENNPNSNDLKVSLSYMIDYLKLNNEFLPENKVDKGNNISPSLRLALVKLITYLKSQNDPELIFEKYDQNYDRILERNEFMNFLSDINIKDLNDDGKLKIINFLDKNKDGKINYDEFLYFINNFDENEISEFIKNKNENEEKEQIIVEEKKKVKEEEEKKTEEEEEEKVEEIEEVETQLNMKNLKSNYKLNKTLLKGNQISEFDKILIKLQGKIIEKFPNSIELTFAEESDDNYCLNLEDFGQILSKEINEEISNENLLKLKEFAERDFEKEEEGIIQCGNFLSNLCDYAIFSSEEIKGDNAEMIETDLKNKYKNLYGNNKLNDKTMEIFKTKLKQTIEQISLENPEKSNHLSNKQYQIFGFNKLMEKIFENDEKLIFQDYNYKETDFFTRPYSEIQVKTILTSEDAALKKCEEIYKSLEGFQLYEDPDFGGDEKCIESIYTNENKFSSKINYTPDTVSWKRPNELSSNLEFLIENVPNSTINNNILTNITKNILSKTNIIKNNNNNNNNQKYIPEPTSIIQGELGDRWFMNALSVVLSKNYMLMGEFNPAILDDGVIHEDEMKMICYGVYPPIFHTFKKKGIFCFKFYKDLKSIYVIIDDRLPVNKNTGQLIFTKCKKFEEFYAPLIEKAYAKLFGCYEKLNFGFMEDGIKDLTGLVYQRYILNDKKFLSIEKDVWKELIDYTSDFLDAKMNLNSNKNGKKSIMSNNILAPGKNNILVNAIIEDPNNNGMNEITYEGKKSGLFTNIGYTIIKVFEVDREKNNNDKFDKIENNSNQKILFLNDKINSSNTLKSTKTLRSKDDLDNRFLLMCTNFGGNLKRYKIQNEYKKILNSQTESKNIFDEYVINPKRRNNNFFIITYSDFKKIFTKLFLNYHFPTSYTGFYYEDSWDKNKESCGGIPIFKTENNVLMWAKNPQYYLYIENDTEVYFNLNQPDGRFSTEKFPYKYSIASTCLIIIKVKNKSPILNYNDVNDIVYTSPVRKHKDNSVKINLENGSYIISCCCNDGDVNENENKKFKLICYINLPNENFTFEKINGVQTSRIDILNEKIIDNTDYNEKKAKLIFSQMKNTLISNEIEKQNRKQKMEIEKKKKIQEEEEEEANIIKKKSKKSQKSK